MANKGNRMRVSTSVEQSEIQGNRASRDDLKYGRPDTRDPRRNDRVAT